VQTLDKSVTDPGVVKSRKLQQLMAQFDPNKSNPGYRVFYHVLAAVVNAVVDKANENKQFKDLVIAALNNNSYVQLLTKDSQQGDAVTLNYYTKFPAVFDGYPALWNKNYYATDIKGKLGFKLLKNKPVKDAGPAGVKKKPAPRPSSRIKQGTDQAVGTRTRRKKNETKRH